MKDTRLNSYICVQAKKGNVPRALSCCHSPGLQPGLDYTLMRHTEFWQPPGSGHMVHAGCVRKARGSLLQAASTL